MLQVSAFRGVRYDPARVGDLGLVTAPPYDVIDAPMAAELRQRHEANVVHLDWTGSSGADGVASAASRQLLDDWLGAGVLKRDGESSLYVHRHTYDTPDGESHDRWGVLATVSLRDADGTVHPHESTHGGPIDDRLELMRATRANLSPIFAAFEDPERHVLARLRAATTAVPALAWRDAAGMHHAFWQVTDAQVIDDVRRRLEPRSLVIADGHHRFESAQRFFAEQARDGKAIGSADRVLMYLTDLHDEGVVVLPIHRLLAVSDADVGRLRERLDTVLEMTARDTVEAVTARVQAAVESGQPALGWCTGEAAELLVARRGALSDGPSSLATHRFITGDIVGDVLGWDGDAAVAAGELAYQSDWRTAAAEVIAGRFSIALIMPGVPVDTIAEVARSQGTMPAKSTYFYPKVPTGLVFHLFD